MLGSRVIVVRAWQQEGGIVVRILTSDADRSGASGERVVASVTEACDVVRRLLEALTATTTDD